MRRGRIGWGGAHREAATALAGVLAERGARELEWEIGNGTRTMLRARETDLPSVIADGDGVLRWKERGMEIVVRAEGMEWTCADEELARALDGMNAWGAR